VLVQNPLEIAVGKTKPATRAETEQLCGTTCVQEKEKRGERERGGGRKKSQAKGRGAQSELFSLTEKKSGLPCIAILENLSVGNRVKNCKGKTSRGGKCLDGGVVRNGNGEGQTQGKEAGGKKGPSRKNGGQVIWGGQKKKEGQTRTLRSPKRREFGGPNHPCCGRFLGGVGRGGGNRNKAENFVWKKKK